MKLLLDTSVLLDENPLPGGIASSISVVSIGELSFGLLLTDDPEERAARAGRLGFIESRFRALPVDASVARARGALQARVRRGGAQPRSRTADLLIAATAQVHGAVLVTHDVDDVRHVADVVQVARPADLAT